jgi:H+/gluconate symporter-like permease
MAALYVVGFPLPFLVGAVILVPIVYILARSPHVTLGHTAG